MSKQKVGAERTRVPVTCMEVWQDGNGDTSEDAPALAPQHVEGDPVAPSLEGREDAGWKFRENTPSDFGFPVEVLLPCCPLPLGSGHCVGILWALGPSLAVPLCCSATGWPLLLLRCGLAGTVSALEAALRPLEPCQSPSYRGRIALDFECLLPPWARCCPAGLREKHRIL